MIAKITWLGTASYILDIEGNRIMFDPFFIRDEFKASNPPLMTKRENIENVNAIFITHGHFDHCTDAAWLGENLNVPVYCSSTAKKNMIEWANGRIIEKHSHPLTEKGIDNIKPVKFFDIIDINEDMAVEVIKSRHLVFDRETIVARVKNKEFRKLAFKMIPYLKGFSKGDVFGFCTYYKNKKIVSYGSLFHKYTKILEKFQDCDIFIAPLAGNSKKNIAKKGGQMVDYLKPKVVVPIHWDDFFPPISRTEDLGLFRKYVEEKHPDIKILMPKIDEVIEISI